MILIIFVGIYVNKNLRLDNIQVYGFDYDYTLAHYSSHLQSLIYDLAKQHMVNEVTLILRMTFYLYIYQIGFEFLMYDFYSCSLGILICV